jgi:two-component system sensor histidine kinase/response regulator
MQISQHSIDNQIFSLDAYQRLRESLIRQAHFFELVLTDAHFTANRSADTLAGTDFILMRSPTLSVLLTASPLTSSISAHNAPIQATPSHHHRPLNARSSRTHSNLRYAPYTDQNTNHSNHYLGDISSDIGAADTSSVGSQMSIKGSVKGSARSPQLKMPRQQSADNYQVNLTFDHTKVEKFMAELPPNPDIFEAISKTSSETTSSDITPSDISKTDSYRQIENPHLSQTAQSAHHRSSQKDVDWHPDAFFLSWAKGLATAPDGGNQTDDQPIQSNTLKNEIEQSLLLNQVITRIRHSLDLPSILETTVAQVREFLSADRLVLYQFGPVDKATNADEPSLKPHSRASAAYRKRTSGSNLIGAQTHSGHISHEARRSEEISSVLNFTEESCFGSGLPNYSRYLDGRPVAIDNVDEQYAHIGCLVDFLHRAQVKSQIIAPIVIKNKLWGLLIAHQCKHYRQWQKTETIFLQHIAEHLAVAIEQASLYQRLQQQKVSLESCVVERTQNLQDALAAAASADRTKGEFLSTMSHELRTPLTYIIGMSATLLRWSFGELSERQRSYLTTINHSGEQLLGVINDILEFAKIESGRSQLNVSDIALSKLMHTVVEHHQAMAKNHDVRLVLDAALDPEYSDFQADSKRIEQILSNLINNAIKFTPAGGQVRLRVHKENNAILIKVEDTGIGIPESQKQFLFKKFKQLESPFRRQYPGTGLGLAMTKHLVELHGGTIQVNSAVGKGSTFVVSLPIRSKQTSNVRYQVPATLERGMKPVVLLIEQEVNSAAVICELLSADGYEVIGLTPAEDIAVQLTLLKPAMLIADLSLLSHRQDEIKAIEQSITAVGTRVLALLSQPASHSSHIAHHDTLDKPIDPKELIEKSRQLMFDQTQPDKT